MDDKTIRKDALAELLDDLLEKYTVVAPAMRDEVVDVDRIQASSEALLDVPNSKRTPKSVFFPQSEVMFSYDLGQDEDVKVSDEPDPAVLFGIRPCDARSFTLLDKVFDDPSYPDMYYLQRRENTTVIGAACLHPQSTCFCTSVGGDPFDTRGMDILTVDLGEAVLVRFITEKGEALLGNDPRLEDATAAETEQVERLAKEAREGIRSEVHTDGVQEKLAGMFEDPFWDELHERCAGCGVCTYLCSTCHCFDIEDETLGSEGRRIRLWDSCMFSLFTLHTSGHNPRASGKERMRQRVMHKFCYFPENYEEIACVGCGRCVQYCPVNMDIREVIEALAARGGGT